MTHFKIIACGLGPNIFFKDVILSIWQLFNFSNQQNERDRLEEEFSRKYRFACSFNSGRSALLAILKSLNIDPGLEIILQSFTCVAVPDAILWAGLKPVFVDIDEKNLGINVEDLEKKITQKTKAVIVQHTFGIPANLDQILAIAKKHNLIVIEDCAHALGVRYKSKLLGSFGDFAFFSFGRDKMISAVFGGMATTRNKTFAQNLKKYQQSLEEPSWLWTFYQLIFNPLMFIIVQTYYFLYFGKLIHFLSIKLNLFSKAVAPGEKKGYKPKYFPKKMAPQLAILALFQLKRIESFNNHRLALTKIYQDQLKSMPLEFFNFNVPFLRFIVFTKDRDKIKNFMLRFNIFLDSWYDAPVAPKDTDFSAISYKIGSCPVAEKLSKLALNLPTNPNLSEADAKSVVTRIKEYYAQN